MFIEKFKNAKLPHSLNCTVFFKELNTWPETKPY